MWLGNPWEKRLVIILLAGVAILSTVLGLFSLYRAGDAQDPGWKSAATSYGSLLSGFALFAWLTLTAALRSSHRGRIMTGLLALTWFLYGLRESWVMILSYYGIYKLTSDPFALKILFIIPTVLILAPLALLLAACWPLPRRDAEYLRVKFWPLSVGLIVYIVQQRLGMGIVAYLLTDLLLQSHPSPPPRGFRDSSLAILLFLIGRWFSLHAALWVSNHQGLSVATFSGGCLNGIVELGLYFLCTLLPMKLWLCKSVAVSLRYLWNISIVFLPIAGLVQGTYMAGWSDAIYI